MHTSNNRDAAAAEGRPDDKGGTRSETKREANTLEDCEKQMLPEAETKGTGISAPLRRLGLKPDLKASHQRDYEDIAERTYEV